MAIKFKTLGKDGDGFESVIGLTVTGKLTKEDYSNIVPEIDLHMQAHAKVNMFMELVDFHGWTPSAAWEDTKFGLKHFSDIERLAIVGDKTWEKGFAYFIKPFTRAKVRYFDANESDKAIPWLRGEHH